MSSHPRAILIDLDDTLIDYGGSAVACWRELCAALATETAGLDAAALFEQLDSVRHWYWSDAARHRQGRADLRAASAWIVGEALRRLGQDDGCAEEVAERYRLMRWERLTILPRAHETLAALRDDGLRLALVTNGTSADQRAKIERFDLASYFDHIQIEGEFGRGKPEPEVYRATLAALGCAAGDAWFVGDNLEWDVGAPQREGIYGIWVDSRGAGVPPGHTVQPDRVIASIAELVP